MLGHPCEQRELARRRFIFHIIRDSTRQVPQLNIIAAVDLVCLDRLKRPVDEKLQILRNGRIGAASAVIFVLPASIRDVSLSGADLDRLALDIPGYVELAGSAREMLCDVPQSEIVASLNIETGKIGLFPVKICTALRHARFNCLVREGGSAKR
ncbi:hypothetical protein D3C71_1441640 [compost metagenome]